MPGERTAENGATCCWRQNDTESTRSPLFVGLVAGHQPVSGVLHGNHVALKPVPKNFQASPVMIRRKESVQRFPTGQGFALAVPTADIVEKKQRREEPMEWSRYMLAVSRYSTSRKYASISMQQTVLATAYKQHPTEIEPPHRSKVYYKVFDAYRPSKSKLRRGNSRSHPCGVAPC